MGVIDIFHTDNNVHSISRVGGLKKNTKQKGND